MLKVLQVLPVHKVLPALLVQMESTVHKVLLVLKVLPVREVVTIKI